MIVDHDHRRVLDVLQNREKATVLEYLKAGKESGLLASVEEVTTDMWDAYVEASREVFGESVAITIDRFHVMKNFQDGLTAARRELQRGLSAKAKAKLKGSRWWWVTNVENLEADDQESFAKLRLEFPELAALWAQREELRRSTSSCFAVSCVASRFDPESLIVFFAASPPLAQPCTNEEFADSRSEDVILTFDGGRFQHGSCELLQQIGAGPIHDQPMVVVDGHAPSPVMVHYAAGDIHPVECTPQTTGFIEPERFGRLRSFSGEVRLNPHPVEGPKRGRPDTAARRGLLLGCEADRDLPQGE